MKSRPYRIKREGTLTFGTRGSGVARFTVTRAIDGPTGAGVLAFATETAVYAVRAGRASFSTVGARPARETVTHACKNTHAVKRV